MSKTQWLIIIIWCCLTNKQQTFKLQAKQPECLDNQVVSLISDFPFVYLRGHFISLFWVSVHENVSKHCLDFEVNTLSFSQWKKIMPIFGKVNIVHKFTCTCSVHILPANLDATCITEANERHSMSRYFTRTHSLHQKL